MTLIGLNRKIGWQNFTVRDGAPADHADALAFTSARSNASFGFKRDPRTGVFSLKNVSVSVAMIRHESWVVRGSQSASLLAHEQLHYTITALGARDLHRELVASEGSSVEELQDAAQALQDKIQTLTDQANEQYDDDSDHNRNSAEQKLWAAAVQCVLANPKGTLQELVSNKAGVCTP